LLFAAYVTNFRLRTLAKALLPVMKTPDVHFAEKFALSNFIVEVATAVSAFIG
jgi:hypothetical protein